MLLTTIRTDQRACSFTKLMDRRSTPDNISARSLPQAEPLDLAHQSTPDNVSTPSQAGHSRLPRRITPDDVDTRWPYRAGYPRLLRPYVESIPIEATEEFISDANFERLRSRIFEILKSYDLPWSRSVPSTLPEVVYRKQEFGSSGLPRVLIHCSYDKDTSCSQKWTAAVAEIYAEIQSMVEGDHEVGVELADMEFMDSEIISLPTPMSQELSANWENGQNYCSQILQLFEARSPMFRVMIPMGRRSVGELTSELTEVIFFDALNAEDDSWDPIEARIRSILLSHIAIDIRQGSGPSFCAGVPENNVKEDIPSPEEYTRPPQPGCDIGAMGSRSAGTMGGYVVTADENGKKTTYGVTNARVALQKREKCIFTASADSGIRMASPSEASRAEDKLKLLMETPRLENEISNHKNIMDAWEGQDPDLVLQIKKFLESDESDLTSAKSTLELMEQDPYVGSVHKASLGDTTYSAVSSQCEIMMDLALIKMHCPGTERPEKIYLKKKIKPPTILPQAVCDTWETDSLGAHHSDGKNHIKVVGKLSRTGIYSFGIVNDFRAVHFPFIEDLFKTDKKTYAWAVSSDTEGKPFSIDGDSGSFVIAAQGWEYHGHDNRVAMPSPQALEMTRYKSMHPFVVGLLFATTKKPPLSYFIPFDAVKSQIESLTGEKLVWPRKRTDFLGDDAA